MTMDEKQRELLAAAVALLVPGERAEDYIRLREAVEAIERVRIAKSLDEILRDLSISEERPWPSYAGTPHFVVYNRDWEALKQVIDYWQERNIGDGDDG